MRVLITRPHDQAQEMASELRSHGIEALTDPVLDIHLRPDPEVDLDGVQAILVTSANGARALAQAVDVRDLPVYAVGDATAETLESCGFTNVVAADGNSSSLAEHVALDLDSADGALLHASGSRIAGDLVGQLSALGFTVRRSILYDAEAAESLMPETLAALRDGSIDAVLFFSPRSAQVFVKLAIAAGLEDVLARIDAICLSPAVAEAAAEANWRKIRVSPELRRSALIDVLTQDQSHSDSEPPADSVSDRPREGWNVNDSDKTKSTDAADGESDIQAASETEQGEATKREDDETVEGAAGTEIRDPGSDDAERPWGASADTDSATGAASEDEAPAPAVEETHTRRGGGLATVLAALALILAVGAFAVLWRAGILVSGGTSAGEEAQAERLQRIEERLQGMSSVPPAVESRLLTLESRLSAAEGDNGTEAATARLDDLAARVDQLAGRVDEAASQPGTDSSAVESRLSAIEDRLANAGPSDVGDLADRVGRLENSLGGTADVSNRLDSLSQRLDGLSSTVTRLAERVSSFEAQNSAAREAAVTAPALLLAVGDLRSAVDAGEPYADPLAAVTALASGNAGKGHVDALSAHAGSGVPTLASLKADFDERAGAIVRAAAAPEGAAWYDRALAEVMNAVTVRRTGENVSGDTAPARVARAEARLAANDLEGAVEELSGLEGAAAEVAAPWIADARARLAVDRALAGLTAEALTRVAPGGASTAGTSAGEE
ncbi:MAG: hypothetical protein CMM50_02830 [Rhodospirillaceae bacterium]|nr:hypothetical protein [Rhodospirillaceae bacterium]